MSFTAGALATTVGAQNYWALVANSNSIAAMAAAPLRAPTKAQQGSTCLDSFLAAATEISVRDDGVTTLILTAAAACIRIVIINGSLVEGSESTRLQI